MFTDHIEVFFIDTSNGWATAEYDKDNNQIGEVAYNYRKSSAMKEARAMSGSIYQIKVFGRDGRLQRSLNNANA